MARSPRTAAAPPTQASTSAPSAIATRTSRRRQSITSTAPSTPFTPGPLTPADPSTQFPGFTPCAAGPSKAYPRQSVEHKSHALRSVENAAERTTCPFPSEYGGREKCGVSEEDEADEVLMAVCGACALLGNRALSPEELARIAVEKGWIRPPSAAVEPTTPFNASIRNHFKRCEKSTPPRPPLLAKHQLAGSVAEQVLESALHPDAFAGPIRPKGTVYFLAVAGKVKWGNPFVGIDVPKPPPKKPGPKKGSKIKGKEEKVKGKTKVAAIAPTPQPLPIAESASAVAPPVKLRLFLNAGGAAAKEKVKVGEEEAVVAAEDTEMTESAGAVAPLPRTDLISRRNSPGVAIVSKSAPLPSRRIIRPNRPFDSSEESETSDTDDEHTVDRVPRLYRPHRKAAPAPISISGSPRFTHLNRLPQGSPFKELFFPLPHGSPLLHAPASPHSSPFPTHSLDNTWWSVRTENQLGFDTSSSSSDEEMRDPDWGQTSGILIQADNEEQPIWAAGEEDEAKLKEATDALRVLFPMSTKDDEGKDENRLMPSDTSSIAESTSTAAPPPLRSFDLAHIPLNAYLPNSSPVPSPVMPHPIPLPADTSPTQHLSRFSSALEQDTMEVDDEDQPWLDEAGEGPIRADPDETLSDSEIVSQLGDTASPEHDRRRHTAEWALNAAVSAAFRIKEEIVDYPSPVTTEPDDPASLSHDISRASSAETQSPSSGSSDVLEGEMDYAELVCGPESMSVEDVDGLYHPPAPTERTTPQKGRRNRCRPNPSTPHRCSIGSWGKIGVAPPPSLPSAPHPTPVRATPTRSSRPTRHSSRRRKSSTAHSALIQTEQQPTPPLTNTPIVFTPPKVEIVEDAIVLDWDETIGTAELELAQAEAEAKEEERRRATLERAEQKRALLEAYRQRIHDSSAGQGLISPDGRWEAHSPLAGDLSTTHWGSSDSLYIAPGSGAVSPMALHSMSQLSIRDMPQSVDPRSLHTPMSIEGVMSQDTLALGQGQGVGGDIVMEGSTDSLPSTTKGIDGSAITQLPSSLPAEITTPTTTTGTQRTGKPIAAATGNGNTDTPSPTPPVTKSQVAPAVPLGNGVSVSVISYIPVYFMEVTGKLGNFRVIRRVDSDFVNITNLLLALDCPVAKHSSIIAILEKRAKDTHAETLRLREAAAAEAARTNPSSSASSTQTSTPTTAQTPEDSSGSSASAPTPVNDPADPKMCYEEGVTGVYVPLGDALYLRDKFKGHAENPVWAILGDDVVIRFRQVIKAPAGSMHSHSFGVNFTPGPREGPSITPPPASAAGAKPKAGPNAIGKKNIGPAHHRANSTTATTAGVRTAQTVTSATGKGPLVRSANGNPDECPQAKRRRATVVGTSPMKATTGANKAGQAVNKPGAKPVVPITAKTGVAVNANNNQSTVKTLPTAIASAGAGIAHSKPNAKPPSMVAPSKPAAPAVTVTPVNGVHAAGTVKPVPRTTAAATPIAVNTAKVVGNGAAPTAVSSPITPAPSVSPAPPSLPAVKATVAALPTLPISAVGTSTAEPTPTVQKGDAAVQSATPASTPQSSAAAAAIVASPLTRRTTRASQGGTGEVGKVSA